MVAIVRFSSLVGLASAIALQSGGQVSGKNQVGSDEVDEARDKLEKEFEKESHKIYLVVQDPQGKMLQIRQYNMERICVFDYEHGGAEGMTMHFGPELTGAMDFHTRPSFFIRNYTDGLTIMVKQRSTT
ncbi:hypothetical protein FOZ61_004467 [Perkinsus olseni]|uniref:Uncharacterized protein n=1 Tax=Perkinsus olseni TaxID=32597 RepID=A0A7J6KIW3_PEROL|nr:hypothetical protein FOZ61_004467 [Perkinsus olseni]